MMMMHHKRYDHNEMLQQYHVTKMDDEISRNDHDPMWQIIITELDHLNNHDEGLHEEDKHLDQD